MAALAALTLLALPLTACSGDDESPDADKGVDGPCAALDEGEFAPASTYGDYVIGSFAIQYELSDGSSECVVIDEAAAVGSYEVAGKDTQIYVDLGDVDLGLTVDIASYVEEGDEPLALGAVPGGIGLQIEQRYYSAPDPSACTVTLAELTAETFAGSFTCDNVPGYADFVGPFGGEKTDASVVSAAGWWRASAA
ncbi:hypothetical protein GCM10025786_30230 [Nocardioides caeni]